VKGAVRLILAFAAAGLLVSCGYRVTRGLPFDDNRVYVAPVINATLEPSLEDDFRERIVEALTLDGRMRLVPENTAGVTIRVTIEDYDVVPTSERNDFAVQYEVHMKAGILISNREGAKLYDASGIAPSVWETYRATGDVMQTERARFEATRRTIRSLARELIGRIEGP